MKKVLNRLYEKFLVVVIKKGERDGESFDVFTFI